MEFAGSKKGQRKGETRESDRSSRPVAAILCTGAAGLCANGVCGRPGASGGTDAQNTLEGDESTVANAASGHHCYARMACSNSRHLVLQCAGPTVVLRNWFLKIWLCHRPGSQGWELGGATPVGDLNAQKGMEFEGPDSL